MNKICSYCGNTIEIRTNRQLMRAPVGICDDCNKRLEEAFNVAKNLRLDIENILTEKNRHLGELT